MLPMKNHLAIFCPSTYNLAKIVSVRKYVAFGICLLLVGCKLDYLKYEIKRTQEKSDLASKQLGGLNLEHQTIIHETNIISPKIFDGVSLSLERSKRELDELEETLKEEKRQLEKIEEYRRKFNP